MSEGNNKSYKDMLISAIVGGAFFAVPYLGLGLSVLPSLGIAAVAFGAGNLMLSESAKPKGMMEVSTNLDEKTFFEKIAVAKRQNAEIYSLMHKVEKKELVENIRELHSVVAKIITTIEKAPEKAGKANTFFTYYLPVTVKILNKYDLIENQDLSSQDSKNMMQTTEQMVIKIKKAFEDQLAKLYQTDIVDTDAEMKVFESMLDAESFGNQDHFNLNK
jgi:5-bromo-4-chloroindolyl phosphate hydrolysis protein